MCVCVCVCVCVGACVRASISSEHVPLNDSLHGVAGFNHMTCVSNDLKRKKKTQSISQQRLVAGNLLVNK